MRRRRDRGRPGRKAWGVAEFRGWGGSSHPDVTVTPQGFSTEEEYEAEPRGHVAGRTTRGFVPGPIPAGTWAAELGIAALVPAPENPDDAVFVRSRSSCARTRSSSPIRASPRRTTRRP